MSEKDLFEKGILRKDRTNEKVIYDVPVRKDGSIERTMKITNQEEANKYIKESAARIDNAGEKGGNISDAADIAYLAEKFDMTYGQVNEVIGKKDWLS